MGADCLQSQWEEQELLVFPLEWSLLKQSSETFYSLTLGFSPNCCCSPAVPVELLVVELSEFGRTHVTLDGKNTFISETYSQSQIYHSFHCHRPDPETDLN